MGSLWTPGHLSLRFRYGLDGGPVVSHFDIENKEGSRTAYPLIFPTQLEDPVFRKRSAVARIYLL